MRDMGLPAGWGGLLQMQAYSWEGGCLSVSEAPVEGYIAGVIILMCLLGAVRKRLSEFRGLG